MARFYLDEMMPGVAEGLRVLGHDVETTQEAKATGITDFDQLNYAKANDRITVTANRMDFIRHDNFWQEHKGIIVYREREIAQVDLAKHLDDIVRHHPDMDGMLVDAGKGGYEITAKNGERTGYDYAFALPMDQRPTPGAQDKTRLLCADIAEMMRSVRKNTETIDENKYRLADVRELRVKAAQTGGLASRLEVRPPEADHPEVIALANSFLNFMTAARKLEESDSAGPMRQFVAGMRAMEEMCARISSQQGQAFQRG